VRLTNGGSGEAVKEAELDHPFPPTKIQWAPANSKVIFCYHCALLTLSRFPKVRRDHCDNGRPLAAVGGLDGEAACRAHKRTSFAIGDNPAKLLLQATQNTQTAAPLTSLDWNPINHNLIGTSSIDTTCTIWYDAGPPPLVCFID